jgi:hypothetical protein
VAGRWVGESVGLRPICVDGRWIIGTQSWTSACLDGGMPCPVFHRVGRVLRGRNAEAASDSVARQQAELRAATEMDSPDCLRLPEMGLRMIVDLLPYLEINRFNTLKVAISRNAKCAMRLAISCLVAAGLGFSRIELWA